MEKKILAPAVAGLMLLLFTLPSLSAQEFQLNASAVDSLTEFVAATGANKMLLYQDGKLVKSWADESCREPMNTASMVKSWTGLVIGILVNQGKIKSVRDPVCDYLPEWRAGCDSNVTVEQLLTMSAGIDRRPAASSVLAQKDMRAFVLDLPLDRTPGTRFSYSNESVQLLGALIEKAAGQAAGTVFRELLFEPLGMSDTHLVKDEAGNDITYGGAMTTAEDAARIGQLMLNGGRYQGRQLVPATWVNQSTTPSAKAAYYGYLWWIDTAQDNYAAMGDFGQMTIVFPKERLLLIRQQSCRNNDPSQNMNWMGPDFLKMIRNTVRTETTDPGDMPDPGKLLLGYDDLPRSQVMVVGTHHFRQEDHYDELDAENQQQLEKLADALAAFRPTKVVLEWEPRLTERANQRYSDFLNGALSIDSLTNETYQLGFRLARKMGHERLYLFDDQTEFIGSLEGFTFDKFGEYAKANDDGFYNVHESVLIERFGKNQEALDGLSLYDRLLVMNSPEAGTINAQRMHMYEIRVGIQKNWMGPDWLGRWYRRNVRMVANVLQFSEPPEDRILIIVGDNHKWVLDQLFAFSPDFELVSSYDYLQRGR
ncbi:serine hydrolase [Flavilitoribacter nigricans]|nr:serine hydrolase [Flavilitoribacter nigricans]